MTPGGHFVLSNDNCAAPAPRPLRMRCDWCPAYRWPLLIPAIGDLARGFNSQFANKLLVMIDGRTVYSPLFSGFTGRPTGFLEDVDGSKLSAVRARRSGRQRRKRRD